MTDNERNEATRAARAYRGGMRDAASGIRLKEALKRTSPDLHEFIELGYMAYEDENE